MDKIVLDGLRLMSRIGVASEERASPRELIVDVAVEADLQPAGRSDDLSLTIDYFQLAADLLAIAGERPRALLESLAEEMAAHCLSIPMVSKARVSIRKPGAVPWAASVGVEIERHNPMSN